MELSSDLISQFVKVTKDDLKTENNSTIYGTIKKVGDSMYVILDGSEMLTPINTITDLADDDRVMVTIDNHTATVTGNVSSPSARTDDVKDISNTLAASNAEIATLKANRITTDYLKANYAEIGVLDAAKARITNLEANTADIGDLRAETAKIADLEAKTAQIDKLDSKYVNINFANIDEASIEDFYAKFGMLQDVTISNGTVTGKLVGVTINGDLIQAGTLVADKLVIRTENGLLYKLNAEALGEAGLANVEDLETLKNGLHGAIINDKTIVAEKISVDDLVAFGATIGGFKIESDSIHSTVKSSVDNTTRGVYMDNDGQFNVGDAHNFLKYYRDYKLLTVEPTTWIETYRSYFYKNDDKYFKIESDSAPTFEANKYYEAKYKLAITADEITFGSSNKNIEEVINTVANEAISGIDVEYCKSISSTELSDESWGTTAPTWENGTYIWSRTKITNADGVVSYSDPVCITGNTGSKGNDGQPVKRLALEASSNFISIDKNGVSSPSIITVVPKIENYPDGTYFKMKYLHSVASNGSETMYSSITTNTAAQNYNAVSTNIPTSGFYCSSGKFYYTTTTDDGNKTDVEFNPTITITTKNVGSDYYKIHMYRASSSNEKDESYITIAKTASGVDGVGISSVVVKYAIGASATTAPLEWSSTIIETTTDEPYLWIKTITTYTNGSEQTTYSRAKDGQNGSAGQSFYMWIRYSAKDKDSMTDSDMTIDPITSTKYIGIYTGTQSYAPTTCSSYQWTKYVGTDGAPGLNGYVHIAYANSADGSTDFSITDSTGRSYIGTYTDNTISDSTDRTKYKWTLIKGADGVNGKDGDPGIGVSSIVEQYYLSSSGTEITGGEWTEESPTWSKGFYIWTRSHIFWDDGTDTYTDPPILANSINGANETANNASDLANSADDTANDAYSEITKLNDSIKNLVVVKNADGTKSTLMEQTEDGWQFNFGDFKKTIDDIGKKTAYVNVDETDSGNPHIELGKVGNDSKLSLTNTEIDFVVGSEIPTKITNKGLEADRIEVDEEMSHGNFVWKKRANGNLGLTWKGVSG